MELDHVLNKLILNSFEKLIRIESFRNSKNQFQNQIKNSIKNQKTKLGSNAPFEIKN
jgi:hypothetical protein